MSEGSEEKTQDASSRKLTKLRGQGQLAQYRDASNALSYLIGVGLILAALPVLARFMSSYFDAVIAEVPNATLPGISALLIEGVTDAMTYLGSVLIILVLIAFVIGIVLNGGFIFSLDPISPKLSNIDPIGGFKRIFGKRAFIELAKSVVKLVAIAAVMWVFFNFATGELVRLPQCSFDCLVSVILMLLRWVLLLSAVLFLVLGILDIPLQSQLFLDQQKMTRTEAKNENKDMNMSSEVQREMRRIRNEAANSEPPKRGLKHVTLIVRSTDELMGFHYIPGETGVPVYCYREIGIMSDQTRAQIDERDIPVLTDDTILSQLSRGIRLGSSVPSDKFSLVAEVIYRAQAPSGRTLLS